MKEEVMEAINEFQGKFNLNIDFSSKEIWDTIFSLGKRAGMASILTNFFVFLFFVVLLIITLIVINKLKKHPDFDWNDDGALEWSAIICYGFVVICALVLIIVFGIVISDVITLFSFPEKFFFDLLVN